MFLSCLFSFELSFEYSSGSGLSAHCGTGGRWLLALVLCNVALANCATLLAACFLAAAAAAADDGGSSDDARLARAFLAADGLRDARRPLRPFDEVATDPSDEYRSSSSSSSMTVCATLRFGRPEAVSG